MNPFRLLPLLALSASVISAAEQLPLLSFDSQTDLEKFTKKHTAIELITGANPGLRVTTSKDGKWPGITLPAPQGKWDLSDYEYVSLDFVNTDTHDIDVYVRLDNPGADGHKNCTTDVVGLQTGQMVTMNIPIRRNTGSEVKLFGMKGYPQGLYHDGAIKPDNIVALTIFTNDARNDSKFEIRNIFAGGKYGTPKWLTMTPREFFPFIDRFGQFIHKDWPGKIYSINELHANRDQELAALANDQGPANWSKWGGWAGGPKLTATGHFRTEKHQGKWALVDPDGYLFFSTGITGVGTGSAMGVVDDRDAWFKEMPAKDDPEFGAFYQKHWKVWSGYYAGREPLAYNFSAANLKLKYGSDWKAANADVIHRRLRSWGLNTMGNWSDGNLSRMGRTPYTGTFFYECPKLVGGKYHFPDVFAENFAANVEKGFLQWQKATFEDPWCIGYFLDNEIPWGGSSTLGEKSLASPPTQAARVALIKFLQERHPDIAALNQAWGGDYKSWDDFSQRAGKAPANDEGRRDLEKFTELFAEKYYATISDIIKKHAPNKLYLGCRSVGGTENVMKIAAKYCDVVSYNRYCYSVRDVRLPGNVDAPVIVGEFHFGALDRGLFWGGLTTAENQNDRGKKYADYVNSALDNPQIVGVHWFQYGDEATVGRADGENAQCGFVDICDTPYPETVKASRETAEKMYARRFGK